MGGTIRPSHLHGWHASNYIHGQIVARAQQLARGHGDFAVVEYLEPKLYIKYLELEHGEHRQVSERALQFTRDAVVELLNDMNVVDPADALFRLGRMFEDWEKQRRERTEIPRVADFW